MIYSINKFKTVCFTLILLAGFSLFAQTDSKFKVVLDPGHGGKDFGANHHGFIEKIIVLKVALKVGRNLEKYDDIEVIYTRKTDVFIELMERARIANRANANLFLSIHCNGSANAEAYGTETFVMGLTKNASNLEVAKKENAVITLESDYKIKYAGYNPNSPESVIGITLLQEEYLDQSITLSTKIQNEFTNTLERKNRGVKQGPFLVLNQTAMPSILTELGFISHKKEGEYMNSDKGQEEIAKAISTAILNYKKEYFGENMNVKAEKPIQNSAQMQVKDTPVIAKAVTKPNDEPKRTVVADKDVVFKIQISASGKNIELVPQNFKGLSPTSVIVENNLYKYYFEQTASYEEAKRLLLEAKNKGYESSFIVAFKNGNKISIQDALKAN
jgi:N-acetylmuramoyl-L-alanine amidase